MAIPLVFVELSVDGSLEADPKNRNFQSLANSSHESFCRTQKQRHDCIMSYS